MRDTYFIHDVDDNTGHDYDSYVISREADGGQTYSVRHYKDERWFAKNVVSGHSILPRAAIGTRLQWTIANYEEFGERRTNF